MPSANDLTGAILTPSQRAFLRDGPAKDMSEGSQRMTRSRIRERLGAAIVDCSIILTSDYFGIDDVSAAFTTRVDIDYPPRPIDLVEEALAMLYLGTVLNTQDPVDLADFEQACVTGIERAETRAGTVPEAIHVDIEREGADPLPSVEQPELYRMPIDRLDQLHLANIITEREFIEALIERHNTPPIGEDEINPVLEDVPQRGRLQLSSPAFEDGGRIPRTYGADEANVNPPFEIDGVPAEAASLALVMDDPDTIESAGQVAVHWLVGNIPPETTTIPEDWTLEPAETELDEAGYTGPRRQDEDEDEAGAHTYRFKLFALDITLDIEAGASVSEFGEALDGHVLAQTQLTGTYPA